MSFLEDDDDDRRVTRRDSALILRLHEREVQVLQWVFADLGRVLAEGPDADAVTKRNYSRVRLPRSHGRRRRGAVWQSRRAREASW